MLYVNEGALRVRVGEDDGRCGQHGSLPAALRLLRNRSACEIYNSSIATKIGLTASLAGPVRTSMGTGGAYLFAHCDRIPAVRLILPFASGK